jgi:hypothetical protein
MPRKQHLSRPSHQWLEVLALTQQQVMLTTQRINVWVPLPPPDVVVVVVVVDVVTGGKGEAANRQFIPSW